MLTIKDILLVLKAKIKWILISAIIFMIAAGGYTYLWIQPIYSSTASLYVVNTQRVSTDITTGELTASQKLVKTYIVVLRSNTTMQQVSEKLEDLGYSLSPAQIRRMITTGSINDTEAFSITASSADPELARAVVMIILEVLPNEIIRVVDAGAVRIIDEATYPTEAYFPFTKNVVTGAAIGVVLAIAIILLHAVFDTKVHGEEKLKEMFTIPIIGRVPSYEEYLSDKKNNRNEKRK
ncbi:MAG: YveK family protein [Lachnospiraceae bacterium]